MRRFQLYLLVTFVSFCSYTYGQDYKINFSNSVADCYGAMEVFDYNIPSQIQFPGNFGLRNDLVGIEGAGVREMNTVWLKLEPNVQGSFEFHIVTEHNVEFNYVLFKGDNHSFCEDFEANRVKPIINTFSSFREKGRVDNIVSKDFSESIRTNKEDVFYLMIHTNTTFTGRVTVGYKRIGEVSVAKSAVQDYRTDKNNHYLRIKIRDKESGEPVAANMIIKGIKKDNYLFLGTDFLFDASVERKMHIETNTFGYFLFSKDFETKNGRYVNTEILLELDQLSPGKKLALKEIKFQEDSDRFLPTAAPELKRLLDFMMLNDQLKVEIQGHVNAPGYKNNSKIKGLSENRAKAVKKYLKDRGVDGDRLTVVGYGNTQMIYEVPKEGWEQEGNRRVEILVIE